MGCGFYVLPLYCQQGNLLPRHWHIFAEPSAAHTHPKSPDSQQVSSPPQPSSVSPPDEDIEGLLKL